MDSLHLPDREPSRLCRENTGSDDVFAQVKMQESRQFPAFVCSEAIPRRAVYTRDEKSAKRSSPGVRNQMNDLAAPNT